MWLRTNELRSQVQLSRGMFKDFCRKMPAEKDGKPESPPTESKRNKEKERKLTSRPGTKSRGVRRIGKKGGSASVALVEKIWSGLKATHKGMDMADGCCILCPAVGARKIL
ncbi:hypothetical protein PPACK8108_LOCUS19261 [Phakopsora pachyrhizi]|uniref:Uncharacterized protein n=1 Tax=Phakopsora pachyrhizi TaxID=170000 RepID=A0AAV0BCC2_PHAPC|nr:hypothetical protein PPACK8108_LOCUS19261 [Phakopsora pachyrhizi]